MPTIKVENSRGDLLDFSKHTEYAIIIEDGLTPPTADVVTSAVSMFDGEQFNYSKLQKRNIVLRIWPTRDVEKNRINLYKWFTSKQWIRLYFSNESRSVYIDGYVEIMDGGLYSNPQNYQVSIICPDPYFKNVDETFVIGSYVNPLFEFPFSIDEDGIEFSTYDVVSSVTIENKSDAEAGMSIVLTATNTVANPKIYRRDTLEKFALKFEMQAGDIITINTRKGEKGVKLYRNGVETNIINSIDRQSKWLQLIPGDNLFTYDADDGLIFLNADFKYNQIYGGV